MQAIDCLRAITDSARSGEENLLDLAVKVTNSLTIKFSLLF